MINPNSPQQPPTVIFNKRLNLLDLEFSHLKNGADGISPPFGPRKVLVPSLCELLSISDQQWGPFPKTVAWKKQASIFKKQSHYLSNDMFFPMMEGVSLKLSALLFFFPLDRKWLPLAEPYITSEAQGGKEQSWQKVEVN